MLPHAQSNKRLMVGKEGRMGDMLHAAVRNLRLVRSSLAKCQTADLVLRKTTAVVRRSQCSRPSTEVSNLINLRFGRAGPSSSPIPPQSDLGFLLVQVARDAPLSVWK